MSLDDITMRLLDKIDKLEESVSKLCNEQTKMKAQLNDHFDDLAKIEKSKERKFYYVIALMGVGFSIIQLIQMFK